MQFNVFVFVRFYSFVHEALTLTFFPVIQKATVECCMDLDFFGKLLQVNQLDKNIVERVKRGQQLGTIFTFYA